MIFEFFLVSVFYGIILIGASLWYYVSYSEENTIR